MLSFTISTYSLTVQQGGKILEPFKKELMGTLKGEMKKNGPVAALSTCHLKAMPITEKHAKNIVGMGRTSHKLRNPKNAPRDWVKPYLSQFQKGQLNEAMVVPLKNGHLGYLEPIKVQPACLVCHGKKRAPGVDAALQKFYPKDQAKDFSVGDFRGLFWLETNP